MKRTKATTDIPIFDSIKELEKEVARLDKAYGTTKVNLVYSDDGTSEGTWACPLDADSAARLANDSSRGEWVYVRLCNLPLGWCGLTWGGVVRAKTSGASRARAREDEQDEPGLIASRDALRTLVDKEIAKQIQKEAATRSS